MAALSLYLENLVLNVVLTGTGPLNSPSTIYLALFTSTPGNNYPTTNTSAEVSGGSYARQAVTFTTSTAGQCSNTADVNFTSMPACTVTHVALMDGSGGTAHELFFGALTNPKTVNSGDTFTVRAADLVVTLT